MDVLVSSQVAWHAVFAVTASCQTIDDDRVYKRAISGELLEFEGRGFETRFVLLL